MVHGALKLDFSRAVRWITVPPLGLQAQQCLQEALCVGQTQPPRPKPLSGEALSSLIRHEPTRPKLCLVITATTEKARACLVPPGNAQCPRGLPALHLPPQKGYVQNLCITLISLIKDISLGKCNEASACIILRKPLKQ